MTTYTTPQDPMAWNCGGRRCGNPTCVDCCSDPFTPDGLQQHLAHKYKEIAADFRKYIESIYKKEDLMEEPDDSAMQLLQYFSWQHLPPHLQEVSKSFADLASKVMELPRNPERTTALRKLLEAKDCAVRARIGGDSLVKARKGEAGQ